MRLRRTAVPVVVLLAAVACTNNPYPDADSDVKVRYSVLPGAPKTLDPAVSYSALEHKITASVYETLLEYHYLKRPYTLMPALASGVPEPQSLTGGEVSYTFHVREGMLFQEDPAFFLSSPGATTREIEASDFDVSRMKYP